MPQHTIPSYLQADNLGPWGVFLQQIDRVTPYLGELAYWAESLKRPKRILIVDVPIKLDNGSVTHFEGYRVQHNTSRGPGKGGVRFHQDVTLAEVMALAGVDDRQERRDRRSVRRREGRRASRPAASSPSASSSASPAATRARSVS